MTTQKPAARAIADVTSGTVLASVELAAPPERVFRAITESAEVVKWWGSVEAYRTTAWQADLRAGGSWRADGLGSDGVPFHVGGAFTRVEAPTLLIQSWQASWEQGAPTTVAWSLEATATGTRLTVRHAGFDDGRADGCRSYGEGWQMVLGWLAGHLNPAPAPSTARYFFCRLTGARPTFLMDMTPDERATMGAHAGYLGGLLAQGKVVVFGPVLDPAGPFGMAVFKVADEAELRALEQKDPAVGTLGFHYALTPMATAVHG